MPRAMSLAAYRQLVAAIPRPTEAQCVDFARFVSTAHSWYKHLPWTLPGVPFAFFIDPFAGYDVVREGRKLRLAPRESQGLHYSALPTLEYRRRFGCLAYTNPSPMRVGVMVRGGGMLAIADDLDAISDREGRWWRLPPEIAHAAAYVTAFVHPGVAQALFWGRLPATATCLPPESGGSETLARLIERGRLLESRENRERPAPFPPEHPAPADDRWTDRIMYDLLEPERRRQRTAMLEAMHRMIDMVYGAEDAPGADGV